MLVYIVFVVIVLGLVWLYAPKMFTGCALVMLGVPLIYFVLTRPSIGEYLDFVDSAGAQAKELRRNARKSAEEAKKKINSTVLKGVPAKRNETSSSGGQSWEVIRDEISDTPGKTQIIRHVVVSLPIQERALRRVLRQNYSALIRRTGFKYRNAPNSIYVYAYESKAHYKSGSGQWIGMLAKPPAKSTPQLTIRSEALQPVKSKKSSTGLSLSQRKAIFVQIVKNEDIATRRAESRYPLDGSIPITRTLMANNSEYEQSVLRELNSRLARENGLTRNQLDEIASEGQMSNWPLPAY